MVKIYRDWLSSVTMWHGGKISQSTLHDIRCNAWVSPPLSVCTRNHPFFPPETDDLFHTQAYGLPTAFSGACVK